MNSRPDTDFEDIRNFIEHESSIHSKLRVHAEIHNFKLSSMKNKVDRHNLQANHGDVEANEEMPELEDKEFAKILKILKNYVDNEKYRNEVKEKLFNKFRSKMCLRKKKYLIAVIVGIK
jgi:hypothetical protein